MKRHTIVLLSCAVVVAAGCGFGAGGTPETPQEESPAAEDVAEIGEASRSAIRVRFVPGRGGPVRRTGLHPRTVAGGDPRGAAHVLHRRTLPLEGRLIGRHLGAVQKEAVLPGPRPLALRANELILEERGRLESLASCIASSGELSEDDRPWLVDLARKYKVLGEDDETVDPKNIDELLARVDAVPVSLVLAQSAEESGWGTSRFAAEGNALFGQWTWGGKGIKQQHQRGDLGDHRIAAFEHPLDSVRAYMHNLNTHRPMPRYGRNEPSCARRASRSPAVFSRRP